MPNFAAKLSSSVITSELQRDFIARLPFMMRAIYGDKSLFVSYGWACNLHPDLWYKPMQVPIDLFPSFMEDSVRQGIYVMGGSDLRIQSHDLSLDILLCHESDIHLDGEEPLIGKIVAGFPLLDFRSGNDWKKHFEGNQNEMKTLDELN